MSTPIPMDTPHTPHLLNAMSGDAHHFANYCSSVPLKEIYDEMEAFGKYKANLEEQNKDYKERLGDYAANLEDLHSTKAELQHAQSECTQAKNELLNKMMEGGGRMVQRSMDVKVDAFDGTPAHLKVFLFAMRTKMDAEKDIYEGNTDLQLRCYITHLTGKARKQIENYVEEDGSISLRSIEELITLLKVAFGDVDEKGTAQRKIHEYKQSNTPFSIFITEWQSIAAKTKFENESLSYILKRAVHPLLLERLVMNAFIPTGWIDLVALFRQCDVTLRSLNPSYHTINASRTNGTLKHTQNQSNTPPAPSVADDAMDLSAAKIDITKIGWTKKDADAGRRPKTDDEKMAKKVYCMVNKLCNWCYDTEHKGDMCPDAIWNSSKPFYTGKKGKEQS